MLPNNLFNSQLKMDNERRNDPLTCMTSSNSSNSLTELDLGKVTVATFAGSDKGTSTLVSTNKEFSTDLVSIAR
jgi:hypothetical protein